MHPTRFFRKALFTITNSPKKWHSKNNIEAKFVRVNKIILFQNLVFRNTNSLSERA